MGIVDAFSEKLQRRKHIKLHIVILEGEVITTTTTIYNNNDSGLSNSNKDDSRHINFYNLHIKIIVWKLPTKKRKKQKPRQRREWLWYYYYYCCCCYGYYNNNELILFSMSLRFPAYLIVTQLVLHNVSNMWGDYPNVIMHSTYSPMKKAI